MTDIRKKLAGKTTKLAQDRPKQEDHPANINDYQEGSFYHIDIKLILPDPEQPKKHFDPETLEELAKSIKEKGLYQPLIVRKDENGQIYLVAGRRRLKAAKIAGFKKIPAIFTQGNPLEISLIENLQRENLKPIEEAEALGQMIQEHGYTEEKLALAICKAQSSVSETIILNRLPDTIKNECRQDDKYTGQLLLEIAKQDTQEAMINFFNQVKRDTSKEGIEVRMIVGEQAIITDKTPAEIVLGRVAPLNTVLPEDDFVPAEQSKNTRLIMELQNLIKIIDAQIS
ncbi:MAG: ParB/RepB/Spo0J family partition protein [Syntrophus sp. (in: bacteria)]